MYIRKYGTLVIGVRISGSIFRSVTGLWVYVS
jgi:hypothetical protein